MDVALEPSWKRVLVSEFAKPYFFSLVHFVKEEYRNHRVYPPGKKIFHAFWETPFDQAKVVILGQDPYHGRGQAHGLCFSVPEGVTHPPSLGNILKEASTDLQVPPGDFSGDLTCWARQGVFLLNTILTVQEKRPGSHRDKGWETFTDAVIGVLSEHKERLVFLLWGAYAQQKESLIASRHCVLKAPHPSPYSADRGFFGCKHFSRTNEFLETHGMPIIQWAPSRG